MNPDFRSQTPHRFGPILALALYGAAPLSALSLHDAQDRLFKENPDLAVMRLEVDRARAQADQAKAAWLPSVDALANYNYTTEVSRLKLDLPFPPPAGTSIDKAIGDHDKVEFGVDASYPIFTGFARGRNLESKRAGAQARDAQWRGARNQMSLRLANMFYAWQLAASQTDYLEKVLEHSKEMQKQLEDFVRAGTAVRSRALAAQAKSKASEVDLLSAQNTRDSLALEVLDFIGGNGDGRDGATGRTGIGGPGDLSADTSAPALPAWEIDRGPRPDLEALDRSADQARLGEKALFGQKLPQLFGVAGWRYANPGLNLAGDSFMSYGLLGLQLRWNLFDGAKNSAQRSEMEIQVRELDEQKRKLERDWDKSMQVARLQYARWTAQYDAASASRDAASASAADLKRQFDAGVATGLDWLEARNNEARAEMLMEQARTMQRIALLQWEYAAGKELRF